MSNRLISSIYLAPEMRSGFFYKMLKPLFLLYDEIYIWQPDEYRLEEVGFHRDEFYKLMEPVDIGGTFVRPFRPAGRELFFDVSWRRKNEYLMNRKKFSAKFVNEITHHSVICPYSTRQEVIDTANKLLHSSDTAEVWRQRALRIFDSMKINEKPDVLTRMQVNAEKRGISVEEANFQEFMMDSNVVAYLGSLYGINNLKLLTDSDHWQAYSLIDESNEDHLQKTEIKPELIGASQTDKLSSDPQVKEFFDTFFNAEDISVKELIKLKNKHGDFIRKYIRYKESSISHNSMMHDSYHFREGVYENIDAAFDGAIPTLSKLLSTIDGFMPSANLAPVVDALSKLEEFGIVDNIAYKLDHFDPKVRKYLIKTKIKTSLAFDWISKTTRPNTESPEVIFKPMFLDSTGFMEDFNMIQRQVALSRYAKKETE